MLLYRIVNDDKYSTLHYFYRSSDTLINENGLVLTEVTRAQAKNINELEDIMPSDYFDVAKVFDSLYKDDKGNKYYPLIGKVDNFKDVPK